MKNYVEDSKIMYSTHILIIKTINFIADWNSKKTNLITLVEMEIKIENLISLFTVLIS